MPTPVEYDISLPADPTAPAPLNGVKTSDKITWTNNTGKIINSFTLPGCVGGQSPAPIPVGDTTRAYTVNSGSKGDYTYYWQESAQLDPRSGTINVE